MPLLLFFRSIEGGEATDSIDFLLNDPCLDWDFLARSLSKSAMLLLLKELEDLERVAPGIRFDQKRCHATGGFPLHQQELVGRRCPLLLSIVYSLLSRVYGPWSMV